MTRNVARPSYFFFPPVVVSSRCISAASFFTERRHIRYLCPHKKAGATLVRAAQLFAYTHARTRSRTWLVQLSHLGACRRLQRVQQTAQRLQARPSPVSHDTSRGSPTYRVSFQCLFFFSFSPSPSPPPLRNSESRS